MDENRVPKNPKELQELNQKKNEAAAKALKLGEQTKALAEQLMEARRVEAIAWRELQDVDKLYTDEAAYARSKTRVHRRLTLGGIR